jgi:hypothetical protein
MCQLGHGLGTRLRLPLEKCHNCTLCMYVSCHPSYTAQMIAGNGHVCMHIFMYTHVCVCVCVCVQAVHCTDDGPKRPKQCYKHVWAIRLLYYFTLWPYGCTCL